MARVERESISPTWINDEQINLLTSTARRFRKEAYCPHCNLTSPPGDHQRTTSQAFKLTHGHMIHNPYQATQLERAICAKHNMLTWYNQTPSHRKQIPPTGQCGAETVMNHFNREDGDVLWVNKAWHEWTLANTCISDSLSFWYNIFPQALLREPFVTTI